MAVPNGQVDLEATRRIYQQEARDALDYAADTMKLQYDSTRRYHEFNVGDEVYLKLHKGYKLPGNNPRKWSQQRVGPFTIVKKVGPLAYELNFPRSWRVHRVVSIAQLYPTPKGGDPFGRTRPQPGRIVVEGDDEEWHSFEIEKLVARRINRTGGKPVVEYLVRWKDYHEAYDEWYPRELLMENAADTVLKYDTVHKMSKEELLLKKDAPQSTAPEENKEWGITANPAPIVNVPSPRKRGRPKLLTQ
ncbi:hypothetical protein PG988_012380 [Apiospora saccharicola]